MSRTWMPSLENRVKDLLWLANTPHTSYVTDSHVHKIHHFQFCIEVLTVLGLSFRCLLPRFLPLHGTRRWHQWIWCHTVLILNMAIFMAWKPGEQAKYANKHGLPRPDYASFVCGVGIRSTKGEYVVQCCLNRYLLMELAWENPRRGRSLSVLLRMRVFTICILFTHAHVFTSALCRGFSTLVPFIYLPCLFVARFTYSFFHFRKLENSCGKQMRRCLAQSHQTSFLTMRDSHSGNWGPFS